MRYRHAWPGFLLLAALAVLLAGLLVWGDRFLTPTPAGGIRRLLQLRPASTAREEAPEPPPVEIAAASPTDPGETPSPASDRPDPPPAEAAPRGEGATAPPAAVPPARPVSPPVSQARYVLDLGTFAIDEDAELAEAQLNQAGFSTVRFRQQAPARLFSVSIRQLGSPERARATLDQLKQEGFRQTAALDEAGDEAVRVAQALPLRSAVTLAERLRSTGYEVHIVAEAAQAGQITLRHGNFASRREADAVSREISGLGVPNEVVQIR